MNVAVDESRMMWFVHEPGWDWCEPGPVFSTKEDAEKWCEATNALNRGQGWTVFGQVDVNPNPRAIKEF